MVAGVRDGMVGYSLCGLVTQVVYMCTWVHTK